MNSNCFEDVIIIYLMYSLALNPESIVLLLFISINESGKLTYWDITIKK